MPELDTRRLYLRWLHQLWPSADLTLAAELVTPDFVGHWPDRQVEGPHRLTEVIAMSLALFGEVATSVEVGPIVDRDLVAARWSFRGSYRGGVPGATAPAGTPIVLRGADVLRVAGGRFAEYWVSSDAQQMSAQLGVTS